MLHIAKHIRLNYWVATVAVLLMVGCESNFKEVQKINFSEFMPSGEAEKMLDYSNVEFPFTEFPKGINVTMYDSNGKRTFITSDYAVTFKGTDLIDLQKNVKISNETGQFLETEQLYFDQKNEWFFTEKKFKFTDPKGVSFGEGIDFSKDFKIVNSQRINGIIDEAE